MVYTNKVDERHYVIGRECDTAMAEKKGFFPCDRKCKTCHACIEILETGERQHVSLKKAGGANE